MSKVWVDVDKLKIRLKEFFAQEKDEISRFGSVVNQTFEAFVLAQVVAHYRDHGWHVEVINPIHGSGNNETRPFRLKFSTRGRPSNYSYIRCTSPEGEAVQIRHQLRAATRHHRDDAEHRANVCLDVAVIRDDDVSAFDTSDHAPNGWLITFAEAKHMSAFAELVAGFIGLVHELQPERLKCVRRGRWKKSDHPPPFLFVSGLLWGTALGVESTISRRKYDIDIFHRDRPLTSALGLPTTEAKQ